MISKIKNFCCQLYNPFDPSAIRNGTTDVLVVIGTDQIYRHTPFICCFVKYQQFEFVRIFINNRQLSKQYYLDEYGFLYFSNDEKFIWQLKLKQGLNKMKFEYGLQSATCQIFVVREICKIVISDIDGTLTKSDVLGALCNQFQIQHIHQDYPQLIQQISQRGYLILWMSMRSIQLYDFSKDYIKKFIGVQGPIIFQRGELGESIKKQAFRHSGKVKAAITLQIKQLFPHVNPFIAGLGNRDNDAIGYIYGGLKLSQIFIVNTLGEVQVLNSSQKSSYKQILQNINLYFPEGGHGHLQNLNQK